MTKPARPVPIVNNLALFARLLSDLSVARDGDQLFRWVGANGGKAADYENLVGALRAFGAYKRTGDPGLMHDEVLNPRNPVWLQSATERLYAGAIDASIMSVMANYYSHADSLREIRQTAIDLWGYEPRDAERVAATLKLVNEEIWTRRHRKQRADKRDKIIVRIIGATVILAGLMLLGMCSGGRDQDCDYTIRGAVCTVG